MCRKLKNEPENLYLKLTYQRYRNFCNKLLKRLKHAYEKCEFLKARNNPKATWKVIKNITHTNTAKNSPRELLGIDTDAKASINSCIFQVLVDNVRSTDSGPYNSLVLLSRGTQR